MLTLRNAVIFLVLFYHVSYNERKEDCDQLIDRESMCEWRIFWPKRGKEEIDIFSIFGAASLHSQEPRTDVYVQCTEAVGIKFRHKRTTEVKQRTGKEECHGIESWSKVAQSCTPHGWFWHWQGRL